jgi:hypothetical protein
MSAAIAPGTPSPGSAEPAPSAESHGIDSILGDMTDVAEAGDTGEGVLDALAGDETAPEAEESTDEAEPVNKAQRLDDDVIFSDEALATKEGVLKAKARALELRKLGHQKYLELKAFERRVAKRHLSLKNNIDKFVADKRSTDLLARNMTHINAEMQSGDPNRMIAALGSWTGQDGLKAVEQFISVLTHRGQPKLDPHVQAVLDAQKQEIEELKGGFKRRVEAEQVQQVTRQISGHAQRIQQQVLASTDTPHVTRFMRDDPQGTTDFIINEITEAHERGERLDIRTYFGSLEARLAPHFEAGRAPQGDGGGPAPKQPSTAQRSPGQSIGPRSTAAATPRVPSEDEALRALAQDDSFMSQFGL